MDAIIYFFSNLIVLNLFLVLIAFTLGWFFSKMKFTRLQAKYDNAELELDKLKNRLEFFEQAAADPVKSQPLKE